VDQPKTCPSTFSNCATSSKRHLRMNAEIRSSSSKSGQELPISDQDRSGVHRQCQGQSGKGQYGRARASKLDPAILHRDVAAFDPTQFAQSLQNATSRGLSAKHALEPRYPMVGSFAGCCARASSGQAAAAPPRSVMNSRRCSIVSAKTSTLIGLKPASKPLPSAQPMSLMGLVSRVTPVHTAQRNCTRDGGWPFGFGNQVSISSRRMLLSSKAAVVNVAETSGHDPGRHGRERRAQANRCGSVEMRLGDVKTGG
jgi:hypothetical protein